MHKYKSNKSNKSYKYTKSRQSNLGGLGGRQSSLEVLRASYPWLPKILPRTSQAQQELGIFGIQGYAVLGTHGYPRNMRISYIWSIGTANIENVEIFDYWEYKGIQYWE